MRTGLQKGTGRLPKESVVLFHSLHDLQSWKLRLALALKPINFESRIVDLSVPETNDEYRSFVKSGVLPALFIDGVCLPGSHAAMAYLEEMKYKGLALKPLLPRKIEERNEVRLLCAFLDKSLDLFHQFNDQTSVLGNLLDRERIMKIWNQRDLEETEEMLTKCAGLFSVGDEVSLADVSLYPRLEVGVKQLRGLLQGKPHLTRLHQSLSQYTEFINSHPDKQQKIEVADTGADEAYSTSRYKQFWK